MNLAYKDAIYFRCENLADLIWQNRQQIKKVELLRQQLPINVPAGCQDLLPLLNTTITGLLSSLVTRYLRLSVLLGVLEFCYGKCGFIVVEIGLTFLIHESDRMFSVF